MFAVQCSIPSPEATPAEGSPVLKSEEVGHTCRLSCHSNCVPRAASQLLAGGWMYCRPTDSFAHKLCPPQASTISLIHHSSRCSAGGHVQANLSCVLFSAYDGRLVDVVCIHPARQCTRTSYSPLACSKPHMPEVGSVPGCCGLLWTAGPRSTVVD
jgi:hypothetical protein